MTHIKPIIHTFVITKQGMSDWYLYTVEQLSFCKRISWTKNIKDALLFTSEEKVESFKSKVLEKVPVSIHKVLPDTENSEN